MSVGIPNVRATGARARGKDALWEEVLADDGDPKASLHRREVRLLHHVEVAAVWWRCGHRGHVVVLHRVRAKRGGDKAGSNLLTGGPVEAGPSGEPAINTERETEGKRDEEEARKEDRKSVV